MGSININSRLRVGGEALGNQRAHYRAGDPNQTSMSMILLCSGINTLLTYV